MGLHKLFDEDYQEEVVYVEERNVNKIAGTLYYTAKMKDLERVITSNNWKNHYKDVCLDIFRYMLHIQYILFRQQNEDDVLYLLQSFQYILLHHKLLNMIEF